VAIVFHCDLSAAEPDEELPDVLVLLPDGRDDGSDCGCDFVATVCGSTFVDCGGAGLLLRDRPRTRSVIAPKNDRDALDIGAGEVGEEDIWPKALVDVAGGGNACCDRK
jgi:hypothetical protein